MYRDPIDLTNIANLDLKFEAEPLISYEFEIRKNRYFAAQNSNPKCFINV